MTDAQQLKRVLRQHLQSERQLGLKEVPLTAPSPSIRPAAAANPQSRAPVKTERLAVLDREQVRDCVQCPLCKTRTHTVFGQGHADARLVFVGEAPGFHEDRQGQAFVGKAGDLLTRMIVAMHLSREDVFICNVLKCRPPNNRDPAPDEIAACSPYLLQQLAIIGPEVIVALGAPAARTLLNTSDSIGRLRGRFHDFYIDGPMAGDPIPLMPTYHPAYLLRSPHEKAKAWSDLQQVMAKLGLTS
ncbi:MAG: uracil-DNA glycosylase [Phycisphaerae bacterium]